METLYTQIIKPSSQTPLHLRKLKLSYLDQIRTTVYIPIIFSFEANESKGLICSNHWKISHQLKQSLSNALTSFYPLAGRIESTTIIDCNDAGVEFIEARAHATLKEAMNNPDVKELKNFLPRDPTDFNGTLLLVKITFFECGGLTIGICLSHKLSDFESVMGFINAWAATCRGEPDLVNFSFRFDLAEYFPAREIPTPDWGSPSGENMVAKRVVFDTEILETLKRDATSQFVMNPTRVEVVSAFIWKHYIGITNSKNPKAKKVFRATHAVNIRKRATAPQLLENIFGNCIMLTWAITDTSCTTVHDQFPELVRILRSSIKKIDAEYIRNAGDVYGDDFHKSFNMHMKGEMTEACKFSSWCGFPLYEVDYGWGNPVSFGTTLMCLVDNMIILVNTRCGEGIEAWVNLEKDVVDMLESQIKLISSNMKDNLD